MIAFKNWTLNVTVVLQKKFDSGVTGLLTWLWRHANLHLA